MAEEAVRVATSMFRNASPFLKGGKGGKDEKGGKDKDKDVTKKVGSLKSRSFFFKMIFSLNIMKLFFFLFPQYNSMLRLCINLKDCQIINKICPTLSYSQCVRALECDSANYWISSVCNNIFKRE